jgi:hypothetical protein
MKQTRIRPDHQKTHIEDIIEVYPATVSAKPKAANKLFSEAKPVPTKLSAVP